MPGPDQCPSEEALSLFTEGLLPRVQADALLRHLAACPACTELVAALGATGMGAPPPPPPAADLDRIAEYRVLQLLGRGAMGVVYLAHDERLDRTVALKLLLDSDLPAQERFLVEARAIARLAHPNVVAIHRVGEEAGRPFLVSEYVHGLSLDKLPLPLPWMTALRIGTDLARGLAAAHRRGVLHRDIKPANAILTEDGTAKLLDFGLAKLVPLVGSPAAAPAPPALAPPAAGPGALAESALRLTQTGALVGTPRYMAPEIWRGLPGTAAADVYSLGALIFELCSGRPPHPAASLRELREAVKRPAPALAELVPDVPAALAALVARCLDPDPAVRLPSGDALLLALEELRPARQRLASVAAEWERLGRPGDLLYGAAQLGELGELSQQPAAAQARGDLSAGEAAFLRACRVALHRRRLRTRAAIIALLSLPFLLFFVGRIQTRREIARQIAVRLRAADEALARAQAEDGEHARLLQAAVTAFASRRRGEGEAAWDQARPHHRGGQLSYLQAGANLEAALFLDGGSRPVLRRYGDVLLRSGLLAERAGDLDRREQIFTKLLAVFPAAQATLERPAELRLLLTPPGASATIGRYTLKEGRQQLGPLLPAGAVQELAPGSYLLMLSAPGRAPVRAPVLLSRGERLELRLELPPAESVPPGLVYIPAGRFLFGEPDEDRRSWSDSPPQHQATTSAYLIGQHEVTVAEFLDFLRALPAAERPRYSPRPSAAGQFGGVLLEELPGGRFRYTLRRGPLLVQALEGEPARIPDRDRRREQDWRRFPIGGIPWATAAAYAAWLDRSGRLPGARPCTDLEWERAARGADRRVYPHGDGVTGDEANIDATYGKRPGAFAPDEVGSHPASRSPFGLDDMLGNVCEWVQSSFRETERVSRGGSFYHGFRTGLSVNRWTPEETMADPTLGFRVCASR